MNANGSDAIMNACGTDAGKDADKITTESTSKKEEEDLKTSPTQGGNKATNINPMVKNQSVQDTKIQMSNHTSASTINAINKLDTNKDTKDNKDNKSVTATVNLETAILNPSNPIKPKLVKKEAKDKKDGDPASIPGLQYYHDIISEQEENDLLAWIAQRGQEWVPTSSQKDSREVLQYGHQYNYEQKQVLTGPQNAIPQVLHNFAASLVKKGLLTVQPTQFIINRYLPGQGISAHTDHSDFGEEISSLSLAVDASMFWSPPDPTQRPIKIPVHRRSLVVMKREARHLWKHAVPGSKKRGMRLSITMRTLKKEAK